MSTTPLSRRRLLALSAAAGSLAAIRPSAALAAGPTPTDVEVLVVGTGYGGSVAALRLAEAGYSVTMLEMGQNWTTPGADGKVFNNLRNPDARSFWFRDRTAMPLRTFLGLDVIDKDIPRGPGALDRVDFGAMNVYVGRGVGGGSLVNGGMAVRPNRAHLTAQVPGIDHQQLFDTYLPLAERELGVNRPTDKLLNTVEEYRFSRMARQTANAAGLPVVTVPNVYDFSYLEREIVDQVPRSATANEVIFGNNYGKRDLTKSYLQKALATGRVTIRAMSRAHRIARQADGSYLVEVRRIDSTGAEVETTQWRTRKLVLAGGSLGSTELLLRSQATGGLSGLSPQLGKGWGSNGATMVGRANQIWQPTGSKQSTIPIEGIDYWTNGPAGQKVFAEICPMPTGFETWVNLYLALTDSPQRATFGWDATAGRMTLDWTTAKSQTAITSAKQVFDRINASQGTIYRSDLFGGNKVFSDNFTYHPLGGCTIGGVTDAHGRVTGQPGMYVVDGALIPGSVGVNPFLTITAMAEQIMATVIGEDF